MRNPSVYQPQTIIVTARDASAVTSLISHKSHQHRIAGQCWRSPGSSPHVQRIYAETVTSVRETVVNESASRINSFIRFQILACWPLQQVAGASRSLSEAHLRRSQRPSQFVTCAKPGIGTQVSSAGVNTICSCRSTTFTCSTKTID